jgi:hypothetical protein
VLFSVRDADGLASSVVGNITVLIRSAIQADPVRVATDEDTSVVIQLAGTDARVAS